MYRQRRLIDLKFRRHRHNGREFGTAINPRVILDQAYQFDFYDGGGLSCAFLSFAEVDVTGNVNVTRFGDRRDGSGGFIDITQNAKRLIFSGTMTAGKFDIGVENGRLAIRRDGAFRKFVPRVGQISFSAALAAQTGQEVSYVTERAVFQLENGGITLTEIAPGARLEEDVLAHMGFRPQISPQLKTMDARIFRPGPMGIAQSFMALPARTRKVA
jgi:propionate CoA-transferase